jgi:hypothetical protein
VYYEGQFGNGGDAGAGLSDWLVQRPMCSISVGGDGRLIYRYLLLITAAIRLARENHPMWQTRSLPPVRPLTIGEVKAGLAVHIMKSIVHGESAGRLV